MKSALTGDLGLSSLHANDAPSTVSRLLDMGLERYQVATSVQVHSPDFDSIITLTEVSLKLHNPTSSTGFSST